MTSETGRGLRRLRAPLLLLAALAASGCTRMENAMAKIPVFSFLRESPALDPYEAPRPAPPHAVPFSSPMGDVPLAITPTEDGLMAFGATAVDPLPAGDTAVLRVGQVMYDRHCSVCHGPQGQGDGSIVGPGKFPPIVPNLTLPNTVARSDGYLYGIIAVGRGLMPAYGPRMTNVERWATVRYVRTLQRPSGNAAAPGAAAAQGR